MITVIITTYKGSRYLARAIDSVLLQTNVSFELIVVDDNSPESGDRKKTEYVMRAYANNHKVKYIKHPKNMNGSVARNTGLRFAHGDYIAFLDDDDFYLPNRLFSCLKAIEDTEYDIAYTDTLFITANNEPINYREATKSGNLFIDLLSDEMVFGTGSNLFVRKKLIDKYGGFDEDLLRNQDYEFLLRMFSKGAMAKAINQCLVVKATNGINNIPIYKKYRPIKEKIYHEFKPSIKKLSEDTQRDIMIYQHNILLESALTTGTKENVKHELDVLKNLGCQVKSYYVLKADKIFRTWIKKLLNLLYMQKAINLLKNRDKIKELKGLDEVKYSWKYALKYENRQLQE